MIAHLAARDLEHRVLEDAGVLSAADVESYWTSLADRVTELDDIRGDSAITYAQYCSALNNGASRMVLDALWRRMDRCDPLRARAAGYLLPR